MFVLRSPNFLECQMNYMQKCSLMFEDPKFSKFSSCCTKFEIVMNSVIDTIGGRIFWWGETETSLYFNASPLNDLIKV